jgi:hypothetical protein
MLNLNYNSTGITLDYIKYLLFNKYKFLSRTNNYDYETHQKFIQYIVDLRSESGVDLTPFINLMTFKTLPFKYISDSDEVKTYDGLQNITLYDLGFNYFITKHIPADIEKNSEKVNKFQSSLIDTLYVYCNNSSVPIKIGLAKIKNNSIDIYVSLGKIYKNQIYTPKIINIPNSKEYKNWHIVVQVPTSCTFIAIFGTFTNDTKQIKDYVDYYNIPIEEFMASAYKQTSLVHSSIFEYLLGTAIYPLTKANVIQNAKTTLKTRLSDKYSIGRFYLNEYKKLDLKSNSIYDNDLKEFIYAYNRRNDIDFNLGYINHYNHKDILGY